jgi:PAS domain S-box-containing protein
MRSPILDYIDFEKVNSLLEGFNKTTGFVTAILDLEGNVLSRSGWRQICTDFHRTNHETSAKCAISDTTLANQMDVDGEYHFYECLNGLVDVAVPIVINGEHVANLFSGQFFFKKPDRDFFRKQAEKYSFDEQLYLKALAKVPVVTKEEVRVAMDFLLNMTQLISEMTYQKYEQSKLNETLRESEERFRGTLDNMLEGCQILGFDYRYIYLNHAATIHNRRSNSELIGQRYQDMWPGIEETPVFKKIQQTLETRVAQHFENEFAYADGTRGWFDLSLEPVREGVFILSIDITERKIQQEKLFESEFRFNNLYENGPFGMVMADRTARFKRANPTFCNLVGYSEEELQNLTFADISHPDDLAKDMMHVKNLNSKELPVYKTEKRYISKTSREIWCSLTATAAFDSNGEFLYNLGVIEDISGRKKAEEDIRRLNDNLEQRVHERTIQLSEANKELEAFSYSVSHDLRSPLRHINGFAEILRKQYADQLPEDAGRLIDTITTAAKRMGTLIDDLLSFSRTGRAEMKLSTFSMKTTVEYALNQLKPSLGGRRIEWHVDNLPTIRGDHNLLGMVWTNLLDNAIKYTINRDKAIIRVGYRMEEEEIVFFVRDNGAGFDMKYADRLFGVFQRLHSSSQFDGTGIGLANVRRIVSRHGGRTWAEAEPEKGAAFYFSLPKESEEKL